MLHLLAEAGFAHTWAHPSLRDALNVALSLNHIVAELFMEALTGSVGFVLGRKLLRRHDRHNHGVAELEARMQMLELALLSANGSESSESSELIEVV